jgi:hypothetical protein
MSILNGVSENCTFDFAQLPFNRLNVVRGIEK